MKQEWPLKETCLKETFRNRLLLIGSSMEPSNVSNVKIGTAIFGPTFSKFFLQSFSRPCYHFRTILFWGFLSYHISSDKLLTNHLCFIAAKKGRLSENVEHGAVTRDNFLKKLYSGASQEVLQDLFYTLKGKVQ